MDVLFVGVGLNSSRVLLKEGVRLVVGFCGERNGWFLGESLVGIWTGFELCVGLRLINLTLLVQGMQGVIERVGLNNSGLLLQTGLACSGANWKGKWLVLKKITGRDMGWA